MRAWLDSTLPVLPRVASRFLQHPGPIGLDIGNGNIHLCQLAAAPLGRHRVMARTLMPFRESREELLGSPALLKSYLRRAMRGKHFRGNHVVSALPPDRVRFMPLMLQAEEKDLAGAVLKMVGERVDGSIADYVVDYLPVRTATGSEERLALAAVAQRDHVMSYLEALHHAGFVVDALDIGPAAIRRTLSSLYAGDGEGDVILVVNTGATDTYLSVIAGRRLLLDQHVSFGETQLLNKLEDSLELSQDAIRRLIDRHGLSATEVASQNAADGLGMDVSGTLLEVLKPSILGLIEEINRVLIYTASETRGRPMDRILLLGSLARWGGFREVLCKLVGVSGSGKYDDLEARFEGNTDSNEEPEPLFPEMAVAVGLALRGMVDDV